VAAAAAATEPEETSTSPNAVVTPIELGDQTGDSKRVKDPAKDGTADASSTPKKSEAISGEMVPPVSPKIDAETE